MGEEGRRQGTIPDDTLCSLYPWVKYVGPARCRRRSLRSRYRRSCIVSHAFSNEKFQFVRAGWTGLKIRQRSSRSYVSLFNSLVERRDCVIGNWSVKPWDEESLVDGWMTLGWATQSSHLRSRNPLLFLSFLLGKRQARSFTYLFTTAWRNISISSTATHEYPVASRWKPLSLVGNRFVDSIFFFSRLFLRQQIATRRYRSTAEINTTCRIVSKRTRPRANTVRNDIVWKVAGNGGHGGCLPPRSFLAISDEGIQVRDGRVVRF